ncbi:MAG: type II secretion system minor pseudopilin GspJ [Maricaulaceae bacterium]|jgi:general secretion pathway protein J
MTMRQAGFSLLEALVTLFIVGMLSSAGVAMLSTTLDGRASIDESGAQIAGLERAHAALKADLAQLVDRTSRDEFGNRRPFAFVGGAQVPGDAILAFVRTGRENPGGFEARGSTAYVEYVVREGALVRRAAVRTDPALDTPAAETALLKGVVRADLAFATEASWAPSYYMAADASGSFPRAVELTLEIEGVGEVRQLFLTGIDP